MRSFFPDVSSFNISSFCSNVSYLLRCCSDPQVKSDSINEITVRNTHHEAIEAIKDYRAKWKPQQRCFKLSGEKDAEIAVLNLNLRRAESLAKVYAKALADGVNIDEGTKKAIDYYCKYLKKYPESRAELESQRHCFNFDDKTDEKICQLGTDLANKWQRAINLVCLARNTKPQVAVEWVGHIVVSDKKEPVRTT